MSASRQSRENHQRQRAARLAIDRNKKAYTRANSFEAKRASLDMQAQQSGAKHRHIDLSQSFLELAILAPPDERDDYIVRSIEQAITAKQTAQTVADRVKAVMHLANLPLQFTVHVDQRHPSTEDVQRAQLALAAELYDTPRNLREATDSTSAVGVCTEAATLLLLQRFATKHMGSGDYTPLPSLRSEDHAHHRSRHKQSNWDLSVFTGDELDPENPMYKLQVKFGISDVTYADDIVVIALKGLTLTDNHRVSYTTMLDSAAGSILDPSERFLNRAADAYSDAILDVMG